MATPTKRLMNWSNVQFTPSGGSAVTLTGVTSVAIDLGGSLAGFAGDGDRYNTTLVNDMNDPSITVQYADLNDGYGIAPGTVGTLTATLNDAKNKAAAGGGGLIYTLSNAVVENNAAAGQHAQYAGGTLSLRSFSTDGVTSPLSVAAA